MKRVELYNTGQYKELNTVQRVESYITIVGMVVGDVNFLYDRKYIIWNIK
jgi:hypothetical protein